MLLLNLVLYRNYTKLLRVRVYLLYLLSVHDMIISKAIGPKLKSNNMKLLDILKKWGFNFFVGVPCSYLKGIIKTLEQDSEVTYVPAVREDTAVGLAVGAYLGGKKPIVLMQNSGLGVSLNAITSLTILYEIPLLMLITWRGYHEKNAPEHLLMGRVMLNLLDMIGVPYFILKPESIEIDLTNALTILDKSYTPVALILRKGVLE